MGKTPSRPVPHRPQPAPKSPAMDHWIQCVQDWFPDLLTKTYFYPPLHFNKVPLAVTEVADVTVLVPQPASDKPPPSGAAPLYPSQCPTSTPVPSPAPSCSSSIPNCPTTTTNCPTAPINCHTTTTNCPTIATNCPTITTNCHTTTTNCPTVTTNCPTTTTNCPTTTTNCPTSTTNCPTVTTNCHTTTTNCPTVTTNCPTVTANCPTVTTNCPTTTTNCPTVTTNSPTPTTNCPTITSNNSSSNNPTPNNSLPNSPPPIPNNPPPIPNSPPPTLSNPPPSVPDPPLAARVWTPLPSTPSALQWVPDSDVRDDNATEAVLQCLRVLGDQHQEVMMVVSELEYRRYLDDQTDPITRAACAASKRPTDLGRQHSKGDFDVLVINRRYGVMVGEVKSVGADLSKIPDLDKTVVKTVGKAVKQLEKALNVLKHLVSDEGPVRVTATLMLPNITSTQLQQALLTSPPLSKSLCQCLGSGSNVSGALSKCLTQDTLSEPDAWWSDTLTSSGLDPSMTDDIYTRLVARFCGPASTVEVWTPTPPRQVIRTQGQAVAEAGLRFSSLALTPDQVALLNDPTLHRVHLQGPPGTGKTVVLVLKALQWLRQGHTVHLVSGSEISHSISTLLEDQLKQCLGTAAPGKVQLHYFDLRKKPENVNDAQKKPGDVKDFRKKPKHVKDSRKKPENVSDSPKKTEHIKDCVEKLQSLAENGEVHILLDEVNKHIRQKWITWLNDLDASLTLSVWSASVEIMDKPADTPVLPPWLKVITIQTPLRCPPSVIKEVKGSAFIGREIPAYVTPTHPVPTQGPEVRFLLHKDQPGHLKNHPRHCTVCADNVHRILTRELRVGQKGEGLQWRDIFIVYTEGNPSNQEMFIKQLRHHGLTLAILKRDMTEAERKDLALAITDHIYVVHRSDVHGLERRVVVMLGRPKAFREDRAYVVSRCSGFLVCFDYEWLHDRDNDNRSDMGVVS